MTRRTFIQFVTKEVNDWETSFRPHTDFVSQKGSEMSKLIKELY